MFVRATWRRVCSEGSYPICFVWVSEPNQPEATPAGFLVGGDALLATAAIIWGEHTTPASVQQSHGLLEDSIFQGHVAGN